MYPYNNQGPYGAYGAAAPNYGASGANALAAAYGSLAQNTNQNLFSSTASANYYGNATAAGYGNYGSNQTSANATSAANAYAQQAGRLGLPSLDAYTAAVSSNPFPSFGSNSGMSAYGSNQTQAASSALAGYGRSVGGVGSAAVNKPPAPGSNQAGKGQNQPYSGFDSAVYAAAASYLQSKVNGTANVWMNKKPGGRGGHSGPSGRGGVANQFNQRGGRNFNNGNRAETQQFYCEVCKISCAGQLTYKEHLEGQRHKKKEALSKGENSQSLPKNKVSFRCDLCNVTCTGQDTYSAHVRGTKHQKTLTLCKKLGKPIPSNEPTIIPPAEMGGTMPPPPTATGAPIPTVGGAKKVVGLATVNFVGGAKLASTAASNEAKKQAVISAVGSAGKSELENAVKNQSEELQALIAAEQNVQPVGEEYIDSQRDSAGKLLQYICKLCDCKFSDPNAKEIHLKGRRHRLQYKMKVDPTLEVDVKPSSGRRNGRTGINMTRMAGPPPTGVPPRPYWGGRGGPREMWFGQHPSEARKFENNDSRYVQAKHDEVYPADDQLAKLEDFVKDVELSLRNVSDFFFERDTTKVEPVETAVDVEMKENKNQDDKRLLKGVMRVGAMANMLLLKADRLIDLIVLVRDLPTKSLLHEVASIIPQQYKKSATVKTLLKVEADVENCCLLVSDEAVCDHKCRITLTSRVYREQTESGEPVDVTSDSLNRDVCLKALAHLRRSNWFEARCRPLQSCQYTLRVLRHLRQTVPELKPLSDWLCELLVEKIFSSALHPMNIGEAFRRFFEAISTGVIMKNGPGIIDPCEKETINALDELSDADRLTITEYCQKSLRLIAFKQIYQVLNVDKLPEPDVRNIGGDRKRPLEEDKVSDEAKKDKKDREVPLKMEE